MTHKITILAPSHNFVGLCLRNWGIYQQSEKKTCSTAIPPPHVLILWRTSAHWWLRSVQEFGAPLQISTGFASWQSYCTAL